jgi:DNA-binding protein HU-beta
VADSAAATISRWRSASPFSIKDIMMSETTPSKPKREKQDNVFKRQELATAVAEKIGLPRTKASGAVDAVLEVIAEQLKSGQEVRLVGFGVFVVGERKAGKGRDPRTGAEIDIPAAKSVRFRASKTLRDSIAGKAA